MTEERTINEEMLEIVKALTAKVEALEKTIYAKDSLLMKAGYVVTDSPTPVMTSTIGGENSMENVSNMDWSDIHKMVEKAGGQ
jgi:7-keto-8-aminopelargonate synthetase-like enzyme